MGAKDWLLVYADGEIQPVPQSAPVLDRQATRAMVRRLYPGHQLRDLADGTRPQRRPGGGCLTEGSGPAP